MNTIILKWNPSFSSYSMLDYLYDVNVLNQGQSVHQNWSVWDHDRIQKGDCFYWLKLGLGQVGIVGLGTIISDPYEDVDWSGKGRQTFYVDFKPEVLLCPEVFEILSSEQLEKEIPDFDWRGGHSGLVLNRQQSRQLENMWKKFYNENVDRWEEVKKKRSFKDTVYFAPKKKSPKSKTEEGHDFV